MPNYEFIEPETGRRVIRRLRVEERDSFPGRVTVPERILVPRPEPTQGDEVLRGCYRAESKPGEAAALHRSFASLGLSADGVKKVWQEP